MLNNKLFLLFGLLLSLYIFPYLKVKRELKTVKNSTTKYLLESKRDRVLFLATAGILIVAFSVFSILASNKIININNLIESDCSVCKEGIQSTL